jgi:hypothetical protein
MVDVTRQIEAEDLAHAREMVQMILRDWNWLTWDTLLADNVALSLSLGAANINTAGEFRVAGGNLQVTGHENVKRVLQDIYGALRSGLSVTTEIVSGYDVALLGDLAARSTNENAETVTLPLVLYMAFSEEGKINKMTITAADLHPLIEDIRATAQRGIRQAA